MNDYFTAIPSFWIFGTPMLLWTIGLILFFVTLTIALKRLILKQKDSDWIGKKGIVVALLFCALGWVIGSWVFSQLH